MWFKLTSGNAFECYRENKNQIREAFDLIDQPGAFMSRFSDQIQTIRLTGYVATFVAVIDACIILLGGR
jgi:hypothetical protein